MKNCLLFLVVVAALMVGAPAYSQHVYADVNGDGLNSLTNPALPDDVLGPATTSVDVYFTTNFNRDGSAAVCNSAEPFTLGSYEFVLRSSGSGSVVFNGWTDNLGFAFPIITAGDGTFSTAGSDTWVGRGGNPPGLSPGTYKVGTLSITVTGTPKLDFATSSSISGNAQTAFGSSCDGNQFDSTIRLGDDFVDSDGTESPTPVLDTTWGKIKKLYH